MCQLCTICIVKHCDCLFVYKLFVYLLLSYFLVFWGFEFSMRVIVCLFVYSVFESHLCVDFSWHAKQSDCREEARWKKMLFVILVMLMLIVMLFVIVMLLIITTMILMLDHDDIDKDDAVPKMRYKATMTVTIRDPVKKKLRYYLGIFPKWRTPPPFGNPLFKIPRNERNQMNFRW